MGRDVALLRVVDVDGGCMGVLCRPVEGVGVLKEVVDDSPYDLGWFVHADRTAVVFDTSGPVVVTSSAELERIASWLSMASVWLKEHGG
jgi:hypothetical protein